jgi:hypothetical protein
VGRETALVASRDDPCIGLPTRKPKSWEGNQNGSRDFLTVETRLCSGANLQAFSRLADSHPAAYYHLHVHKTMKSFILPLYNIVIFPLRIFGSFVLTADFQEHF